MVANLRRQMSRPDSPGARGVDLAITALVLSVGGTSARQGALFGMCWPTGFVALFVIEGAVSHAGASAAVMGVIGAVGPLLVTGLIYVTGAAMWLDAAMLALGIWLLAVASAGGWAGPVGALAVDALAGGGGFLAAAAFLTWKKQG